MATELCGYAVALLATLLLETAVALALGYRRRCEIVAVLLVNLFTHPLLCFSIWTIGLCRSSPVGQWEIVLFEAVVVLVEWVLLCFALKQSKTRLFFLSLAMNGVSYIAGLLAAL